MKDVLRSAGLGLVVLAFWGLVTGIILDLFFGAHIAIGDNESSSFSLMMLGGLVGAAGGACIELSTKKKERESKRQFHEDRIRRQELEHSEELKQIYSQLTSLAASSVQAFELLPQDLHQAREWEDDARKHFVNHAYSPFWHAVEQGFSRYADYNDRLNYISHNSLAYIETSENYRSRGGSDPVNLFPVNVVAAEATQSFRVSVGRLNNLVYEAQRDPVFAQIWEQRRTTTAIISGFSSLEAAVQQMSGVIGSSVAGLNSAVNQVSQGVLQVQAEIYNASTAAQSIGAAQLANQKYLNDRIDKAVYYLKEEHRRALQS